MNVELFEHVTRVAAGLNDAEKHVNEARGFKIYDTWHVSREGQRFVYLDCGGSGAFLVEKATGELYNIKGYGVADHNKKKKADLGNVAEYLLPGQYLSLLARRYNYLTKAK